MTLKRELEELAAKLRDICAALCAKYPRVEPERVQRIFEQEMDRLVREIVQGRRTTTEQVMRRIDRRIQREMN